MLANLMPLANDPAVEGYLLRIETMLKEHMGIEHDNWNLTPIEISLSESDPIASLKRAIRGLEMITVILLLAALGLEASAIVTAVAFMDASSGKILLMFLFMHATASLLLAQFVVNVLPEKYRQPRIPILALLFNFSFFIPLLGLIGMLTAVVVAGYRRHIVGTQPFTNLVLPEFVLTLREPEGKFSQGGIRSRLAHSNLSTPERLQSLLALQGMPSRISSPLLQDLWGIFQKNMAGCLRFARQQGKKDNRPDSP